MSINHTLYTPLRRRPISVNIETKRTGEDLRDAQYKIQIWCAAQFAKIEELIRERRELRQTAENDQNESCDGDGMEPPFLPGIIIQCHDWNFVAAVRGTSKKTVSSLITFANSPGVIKHSNWAGVLSYYPIWRYENPARPLSDNYYHANVGVLDTRHHRSLV